MVSWRTYLYGVIRVLFGGVLFWSALSTAHAEDRHFMAWRHALYDEARGEGISAQTLEATLNSMTVPLDAVLSLYNNQPEYRITLARYLEHVVNEQRIDKGKKHLIRHKDLLDALETRYGVSRYVIVALWGAESDFGDHTGSHAVIPSLATLAYGSRRKAFYRQELLAALHMIDQGYVASEDMRGSWAGAMGQVQFIPSTYRAYAVDYNGDGKKDIWHRTDDALASAASLLSSLGWQEGEGWGFEVTLPSTFQPHWGGRHQDKWRDMATWWDRGVTPLNQEKRLLPPATTAALILPERNSRRAFLALANFETILLWNRSDYFAISIGMLADALQE
ncbi:MAG: lytic murein transglycosylase [Alphaproteobacteria bacterium GM7ARS4]|nr:lytic murein transglycosylase [Alphaproteobacteria bacterium GM7ARS4]